MDASQLDNSNCSAQTLRAACNTFLPDPLEPFNESYSVIPRHCQYMALIAHPSPPMRVSVPPHTYHAPVRGAAAVCVTSRSGLANTQVGFGSGDRKVVVWNAQAGVPSRTCLASLWTMSRRAVIGGVTGDPWAIFTGGVTGAGSAFAAGATTTAPPSRSPLGTGRRDGFTTGAQSGARRAGITRLADLYAGRYPMGCFAEGYAAVSRGAYSTPELRSDDIGGSAIGDPRGCGENATPACRTSRFAARGESMRPGERASDKAGFAVDSGRNPPRVDASDSLKPTAVLLLDCRLTVALVGRQSFATIACSAWLSSRRAVRGVAGSLSALALRARLRCTSIFVSPADVSRVAVPITGPTLLRRPTFAWASSRL